MATSGKVYFSVFAGRRRFLSVLMMYVRPLLDQKAIDVVHLWDYCRAPPDREYLKTLADSARGIEVVAPPASDKSKRVVALPPQARMRRRRAAQRQNLHAMLERMGTCTSCCNCSSDRTAVSVSSRW